MAWQVGVAQTVPLVCLLNGVPTTPTAAITTTVNVAGAGYGAATNGATVAGANGEASVLLTGAEMGAWGFVRVEGANGSLGIQPWTAEGDWTTARANKIDDIAGEVDGLGESITGLGEAIGALPGEDAIEAALATAHGSGRWDSAGTVAVLTTIQRIVADGDSALTFIRGDTHLVQFAFTDADSGAAIDLSGYTLHLTIRSVADRDSAAADDSDAIATIVPSIVVAAEGSVRFSIDADDTAEMERGVGYDYDVQGVAGSTVTTFVRGSARVEFDVTRATS